MAAFSRGGQAPVARNPFAAAPAQAPTAAGGAGAWSGSEQDATGPMLGRGSELQQLYNMPATMGHESGVNCMAMVDDKIYTGGRDNQILAWRGQPSSQGGFELQPDAAPISLASSIMSICYEPASKWLFCGLWGGEIQAFCKDPVQEDRLTGHRRSVGAIVVHSSVVISGSHDGTVRLWTMDPQTRRFRCHGQPLENPSGPVSCLKVLGDCLWVGGMNGLTCFDLNTLQPRGTIPSVHQVTRLVECQGYMIATFKNGDCKIYDAAGNEIFSRPSRGEHQSNTAVEIMVHPVTNKPVLLCGQLQGYITAYDLPEFRPRGSWVCKQGSEIKSILDATCNGMFVTGGSHGDIMVWKWGAPGQTGPPVAQVAASPFAASTASGAPVAASPFAGGAPGFAGGAPGFAGGGFDSMVG